MIQKKVNNNDYYIVLYCILLQQNMAKKNGIQKLMKTMKNIVVYTKCSVKMLTNFYKCVIYYFLDIIKYLFLFLIPGIILMCFGFSWKKWAEIFNRYKYIIDWSNSTLNKCYRCKNKKAKKNTSYFKNVTLKKMIIGGSFSKGNFSFYTFFTFVICLLVLMYCVYFLFI